MIINKELEEKLKEFPEELEDLAFDILEDISNLKKSKKQIEDMILKDLALISKEDN